MKILIPIIMLMISKTAIADVKINGKEYKEEYIKCLIKKDKEQKKLDKKMKKSEYTKKQYRITPIKGETKCVNY